MAIEYFKGAKPYIAYGACDDELNLMTIILTLGKNHTMLQSDCSAVADANVPNDTATHVPTTKR